MVYDELNNEWFEWRPAAALLRAFILVAVRRRDDGQGLPGQNENVAEHSRGLSLPFPKVASTNGQNS